MFIKDADFVEIKVYWKKTKNKYESYTENEFNKLKIKEEVKSQFNLLNIKACELYWELYNKMQEEAYEDAPDNTRRWSLKRYKENKLKKIVKDWDAKNEKGDKIPVSDGAILHLAPVIAEAILRAYDDATLLSEEDEKN